MKVQTLLLVSFYLHLSIGMPQIQRPSARDNMVGGFKPLRRNRNGRRFEQNLRTRKLRPAFAPPAFYASPMFREFQEANLPTATARSKKITQDIMKKKTEESLSSISKNSPRLEIQKQNKSTQRQGKILKSNVNPRIKQTRQRKSFRFRPGQGQAGILPLAYQVADFPITGFRYPPYKESKISSTTPT